MELTDIKNIKVISTSIHKYETFKYLQLKKSVQLYGQLRPIIVNSEFEIIDGYLLFQIFQDLEFKKVYIKKLSIENYKEFRLSYNSLVFDLKQIQFLKELQYLDIDEKTNIFPYTNEEINAYKKLFVFDWDQYKKPIKKKVMF